MNPILFAGTWQQYSKKAIAHEKAITPNSGQLLLVPVCCSFRCPYQARVMKMLLAMSSSMVYNPFMKGFDINVSAKVLYFSFIVLILWLNIVEISSVLHLS